MKIVQKYLDNFRLFAEAGQKLLLRGLITGLAKKGEHILFVSLHAGLVEGVDAQKIAADAAGFLEEVDEIAEAVFVHALGTDYKVGHVAVRVGKESAR